VQAPAIDSSAQSLAMDVVTFVLMLSAWGRVFLFGSGNRSVGWGGLSSWVFGFRRSLRLFFIRNCELWRVGFMYEVLGFEEVVVFCQ
jgi:hypothetical protein